MNKGITIIKVNKEAEDSLDAAIKYYSLFSMLSGWKLTPVEINLIAFTAIKGNISSGGTRNQFIEQFNSTKPSLNNFIYKLSKLGYIIKEKDRIMVHPSLKRDFSQPIVLQISLYAPLKGKTNRKDSSSITAGK
jgi:hypothetical protein